MDKAEIIARTLTQMNRTTAHQPPYCEEQDEEEFIVSILQDALPDGDIRTCEDFAHLSVQCCDICHGHYAHYELSLIELPDGGKAWVCHAVKQTLYPERYRSSQESKQMLKTIFREPDDSVNQSS